MARIAKSLDVLLSQINQAYPNRSKVSDGWIGDTAHAARASDHNPGPDGVVEALDITHDPKNGPDTWKLAETLRINRDPRIKYVISNGRIFSSQTAPWQWRTYNGANKHAHHIHVSVMGSPSVYDRADPWKIDGSAVTAPAPPPPKPKGVTEAMRRRMMETMLPYEGRVPPKIHIAPDGRPEIAGITQKDHPQKFAELRRLLDAGQTAALVNAVIAYYDDYTDPAQNWTDQAGPEFFLRDCILNRGPTGAAKILQMAVGVEVDGQVGPTTRGALAALNPDTAIDKLRRARERYEDIAFPNRRSSGQWQGMLNRWNKAAAAAKEFQRQQHSNAAEVVAVIVTTTTTTSTAVAVKKEPWTAQDIAMAGFIAIVAAIVVTVIVRKLRNK